MEVVSNKVTVEVVKETMGSKIMVAAASKVVATEAEVDKSMVNKVDMVEGNNSTSEIE